MPGDVGHKFVNEGSEGEGAIYVAEYMDDVEVAETVDNEAGAVAEAAEDTVQAIEDLSVERDGVKARIVSEITDPRDVEIHFDEAKLQAKVNFVVEEGDKSAVAVYHLIVDKL